MVIGETGVPEAGWEGGGRGLAMWIGTRSISSPLGMLSGPSGGPITVRSGVSARCSGEPPTPPGGSQCKSSVPTALGEAWSVARRGREVQREALRAQSPPLATGSQSPPLATGSRGSVVDDFWAHRLQEPRRGGGGPDPGSTPQQVSVGELTQRCCLQSGQDGEMPHMGWWACAPGQIHTE